MQNFQRGKDNSEICSHSEVGTAVERPFSWLSGRESTASAGDTQDGSLAWEDPASLERLTQSSATAEAAPWGPAPPPDTSPVLRGAARKPSSANK